MVKKIILLVLGMLAQLAAAGSAGSLLPDADLAVLGRGLLAKWRKCQVERGIQYKGKSLAVERGVKSSHDCCVVCKKTGPRCDRWTYLPAWDKCTLLSASDDDVYKVQKDYYISGYASWRLKYVFECLTLMLASHLRGHLRVQDKVKLQRNMATVKGSVHVS